MTGCDRVGVGWVAIAVCDFQFCCCFLMSEILRESSEHIDLNLNLPLHSSIPSHCLQWLSEHSECCGDIPYMYHPPCTCAVGVCVLSSEPCIFLSQ